MNGYVTWESWKLTALIAQAKAQQAEALAKAEAKDRSLSRWQRFLWGSSIDTARSCHSYFIGQVRELERALDGATGLVQLSISDAAYLRRKAGEP